MNDPVILQLLARQHGVATSAQLRALGVPARSITYFRQRGVLEQMLPGVWRAMSHPTSFESRALAVQLHAGDGAALSGPTAGRLSGLRQMPSGRYYVVASVRSRARVPRWVVRTHASWLDPDLHVVVVRDVFRVLEPLSMLLTLAESFNDYRFERAAEDAWHLGLVTPAQARCFLAENRGRGRQGVARFDRWLSQTAGRSRASQSGFEMEVLQALRAAGLPEPERQFAVTLLSGEVVHLDIAWPDAMLAVEPGHTWWHGGDLKMSSDYDRDRSCGRIGWHVARLSERARGRLASVAAELADTYRLRRSLLTP